VTQSRIGRWWRAKPWSVNLTHCPLMNNASSFAIIP
jgi:hypothetical protein